MQIKKITQPGLSINTYLLIDEKTHLAAIVDPVRDIKPVIEHLQLENAKPLYILETHVHADFVSGARELKHYYNEAPQILCSAAGGKEWIPDYADLQVQDQEVVELGDMKLQAWHVPGHTPEHLMWVVLDQEQKPVLAFTGDFLLPGSVGRPDLLGTAQTQKLAEQLYHSLFDTLNTFPDHLLILPAHGAGSFCGKNISSKAETTLGEEKQTNPFLQKMEKQQWIKQLLQDTPQAPSYFSRLKQQNVQGLSLSPKHLSKATINSNTDLVVDIRHPDEFAIKHISGSVNIGSGPSFIKWAGEILLATQPIMLIGDSLEQIQQAATDLRLVGLDNLKGYVLWQELVENKPQSFGLITPEALSKTKSLVIDVRTDEEWKKGHIAGARHIPLPLLLSQKDTLPTQDNIVLVCGSGYRSSIGASLLEKNGFSHVASMKGGMQAWQKAHLDVVT